MRSASWSASSRYCVVRKTVVPASASERITSHSSRRLRVSSPVVGSSRNSTSGVDDEAEREVEAAAHAAGVGADALGCGIRQTRSARAAPRRALRAARRESPDRRPIITTFSVPVSTSSTAADWPVRLMRCLTCSGSRDDVDAGDRGGARVGADERREHVDRRGLAGAVRAEQGEDLAAGRRRGRDRRGRPGGRTSFAGRGRR